MLPRVAKIRYLLLAFLIANQFRLMGQADVQRPEAMLIETYWKYAYTLHLESGTVVHQSDDNYELYLIFHYDSIFRLYNNGVMIDSRWSYADNKLKFPFRQVDTYRIIAANNNYLELSFTPPNTTSTFIYHFTAEDRPVGMFARRPYELPEILVKEQAKLKTSLLARKEKLSKREQKRLAKNAPPPTLIQVEITGGGYYGGVDPVLRNHIVIKSDGRLVQEHLTKYRGLTVTKKSIPREELEAFITWAEEQKFFELERQYDCKSSICSKRMDIAPKPMPLRITITYGQRRKMVTVSIWGKDKTGEQYVEYPPQIDHIVEAVQRMANRI